MIFTTNKPLSEWGKVLHDEDLAAAILDRILERGRLIRLDGPSGRTRYLKLEDPLPSTTERVRISGIRGSEFSEPTAVYPPPSIVWACPIRTRSKSSDTRISERRRSRTSGQSRSMRSVR